MKIKTLLQTLSQIYLRSKRNVHILVVYFAADSRASDTVSHLRFSNIKTLNNL